MIYNDFKGLKLSALGMGCMRLPGGGYAQEFIEEKETEEMVNYAFEHGINYFDTAWGYHSGKSETVMGKLLSSHPRESYYLATKFPGYDLSNMTKVEQIFNEQLKKCQTEYFDFYLFHNVCEMNINQYLDPKYGIFEYLHKQKENGKIRHLGFSAHGSIDVIKRFLEKYGEFMEFGQLQLNWLDWKFQNADEKVALLNSYNIPVWVMEPLRGGKLAALHDEYMKYLDEKRPGVSSVEWAFRFLQSIPGVTVTLSGMSSLQQMKDNIAYFENENKLNEDEMNVLQKISALMTATKTLPCTACRYCVDHCPQGLNIPELISFYNEHCFTGGGFLAPMALSSMPAEKQPSACIGCRSCEAVCPQQIKISEAMADFSSKING